MRAWILAGLLVLTAAITPAQRHKLGEVNAETPEGKLLQEIGQEQDAARKLGLLEGFVAKHPKHEAAAWAYSQMQPAYLKANQFDKALEIGEKLLALDPLDVETSHQSLKAAEAKKDPDLVKKWAGQTSDIARKVAQSKQPADEDEVAEWKRLVEFSKQVDTYTEYALFATAIQTADPARRIDLIDTLAQRNAQSQYLPQLENSRFLAYYQLKDLAKAVSVAEQADARNAANEDMLLVAAEYHFNQKGGLDKAMDYSAKVVAVLNAKPAPPGVSPEDWEKKKRFSTGRALWFQGMTYNGQSKYAQGDKTLREALPYQDDEQYKAAALFQLGLANYRLGDVKKGQPDTQRILDALRFFQQCAAIKSPNQAPAQRNITAIKAQYRVQ